MLCKAPDSFAVEVKDLEEATDALERTIARILSSDPWREVGDDADLGTGLIRSKGAKAHKDAISIEDLYSHSYSPPPKPHSRWLWIPKTRVLEAAVEGYPASIEEVWRFGAFAWKIAPAKVKLIDSRSFSEVVGMDHRGGDRRGDGLGSGYQRRYGA